MIGGVLLQRCTVERMRIVLENKMDAGEGRNTERVLGIPEFLPDPTSSSKEYSFVNIWLVF